MHARVHECISVCVCVYYTYMCVCVCVCVYYIQKCVCYECCISESQFFQQLLAGLILTERLC